MPFAENNATSNYDWKIIQAELYGGTSAFTPNIEEKHIFFISEIINDSFYYSITINNHGAQLMIE